MTSFTEDGIIGQSGRWYSCREWEHIRTILKYADDAPFVTLRRGNVATFDAYYTVDKAVPTRAQFETLMNWCTAAGERFEDVTDCWSAPWQEWREIE